MQGALSSQSSAGVKKDQLSKANLNFSYCQYMPHTFIPLPVFRLFLAPPPFSTY